MFICSREIGQSLVIAERILVKVAVVGQDFVDLGLSELSGRRLSVLTVGKDASTNVINGVQVTFIGIVGRRVRLGFEHPPGVTITRLEFFTNNGLCNER